MDNKTEIINVDSKTLEELVKGSALTLEGLAESSFDEFLDWVKDIAGLKTRRLYVTKGKLANGEWLLTGDNAYRNDLNIVSVKLDDMEDRNKIVMARFQVGARWMDDIHDNNVMRERESAQYSAHNTCARRKQQ